MFEPSTHLATISQELVLSNICIMQKCGRKPTRLVTIHVFHNFIARYVLGFICNSYMSHSLKPRLHWNANRTRTRHAKTMQMFDVDVFLRRGKQHLAVWQTFGEQPDAICRLLVHQREFAYNTFMYARFAASANAEQSTNLPTWTYASFLHAAFVFAFRCKPALNWMRWETSTYSITHTQVI